MLLNNRFEIRECTSHEEKERVWEAFFKVYPNGTHGIENIDTYIEKVVNHARIIAVYDAEVVVGFVAFYANDVETGVAYITQILVVEEYRHFKLGKALLDAFENVSKDNGFKTLRLEVNKANVNAIGFYNHLGFVRETETEKSFYLRKQL